VLPRTDIDNDDNDSHGQSFQEVQSRRAKQRRQQSNILQQQQPSAERRRQGVGELQVGRQQAGRQRNSRLMTGTSATSTAEGLTAGKKLVGRAVFGIDNVSTLYSVDDVKRYVSSISVNVLSCFQSKPRRRRNESEPVTDRRAFRLRIDADDRDTLLDPAKWPESITISQRYYVPPSASKRRSDTGGQTDNTVRGSSPEAREPALIGVSVAAEVHNPEVTEDIEPINNDYMVLEINLDTASVDNGV